MANQIRTAGGPPSKGLKEPKYAPIFIDRSFTGLFTQRSPLHDPSDLVTARFYGGRPDTLWDGLNVELTNDLTLARRPGLSLFSSATYPTPILSFYPFVHADNMIELLVDTQTTGSLVLTGVAASIGSTAVYAGSFPNGGSNAYVGLSFLIAGFLGGNNNSTFVCTASTTTQLTLANANATLENNPATAISAGAVFRDNQDGTKTLIFAKSTGASATRFVANDNTANTCYMGNGIDTVKYTPGNANGLIWKWGIDAPPTQPSVTPVASGAASPVWQANTIFSTMGLTVDTFGQVWQLVGVNADASNSPNAEFGTAGNGSPTWKQTLYGQTTEGAGTPIVWQNLGPINPWVANLNYGDAGINGTALPVAIYDPATSSIYFNFNNHGGVSQSGSVKPSFNGVVGSSYWDNHCHWFFEGKYTTVQSWKPSHAYPAWYSGGGQFIIEPFLFPPPSNQDIYVQVPTNTGTSGASYAPFLTGSGVNTLQPDGQLLWLSLGSGTWTLNTSYLAWTAQGAKFSCIDDGTNMQVCIASGSSAGLQPGTSDSLSTVGNASAGNTTYTGVFSTPFLAGYPVTITGFTANPLVNNGTFQIVSCNSTTLVVNNAAGVAESHLATAVFNPWGTAYGQTISDGSVRWVCVGPQVTWVAGSSTTGIWNLPPSGFQPPQASQAYGGSSVDSSTALVETVIISGKSGTVAPSWGALGTNTTDNGITWYAESAVSTNSLSWTTGLVYAYSYKARAISDAYSPAPVGGGLTPPGSTFGALGVPTGSESGAISTASPVFTITGFNAGAVNTVSGVGSLDTQVDTIIIWRSADGGGPTNMFELTEIPSPAPIGGVAQPWIFKDYLPDVATSVFPGLNTLIPAPIDEQNNPPQAGFLPMAYHFNRIWGAIQTDVFFSLGPDQVNNGNPNESFDPADEFPFLSSVTRAVHTPNGLVIFTSSNVEIIQGGPNTSQFFSTTLVPGVGLLSFNALDIHGGIIYFFSADRQFNSMDPNLAVSRAGFPIGDKLASWDPNKVYISVYESGVDNSVIVSDGSTGWYRLNPHQVPQGEAIWSPFAAITGGCQAVQAVEVIKGTKYLLVGATTPNQSILKRDLTVWTDNGSAYDAFFVMGAIGLAFPGQMAQLGFIESDFTSIGSQPVVSYLLDGTDKPQGTGIFFAFTSSVNDPPDIYGTTVTPSTGLYPNRYYFMQSVNVDSDPPPAYCRHLMIKVDFGNTDTVQNEMLNLTVFAAENPAE